LGFFHGLPHCSYYFTGLFHRLFRGHLQRHNSQGQRLTATFRLDNGDAAFGQAFNRVISSLGKRN
jgi:hypothetical protein